MPELEAAAQYRLQQPLEHMFTSGPELSFESPVGLTCESSFDIADFGRRSQPWRCWPKLQPRRLQTRAVELPGYCERHLRKHHPLHLFNISRPVRSNSTTISFRS